MNSVAAALASGRVVEINPTNKESAPDQWIRAHRRKGLLFAVLIPVAVLLAWQLSSYLGLIDLRIFSSPERVATRAWGMVASGELWTHVTATGSRVLIGYSIGAVAGVFLGLIIGWVPLLKAGFRPLFSALYTVPKLGIFPFMLLIFGLTEMAKWALVGLGTFLLVALGTIDAVASVQRSYLDAATAFRSSRIRTFFTVIVPASAASVFTSLRLAIGYAVLVVIGTEFVSANEGIGWVIWNSWSLFQADRMFVGIIASALLGFIASSVVNLAQRLVIRWDPS